MSGTWARSALGLLSGLVFLASSSPALAQRSPLPAWPVAGPASPKFVPSDAAAAAVGSIGGTVRDDRGEPVAGVVVTAVGATTSFAVTDEQGRYEIATLTPGPYLLRVHFSGFVAPTPRSIEVRPRVRATSSFAIRKSSAPPTVLAAGMGVTTSRQPTAEREEVPPVSDEAADAATNDTDDDHSETAWYLRHLRRAVLRDMSIPGDLLDDESDPFDTTRAVAVRLGRAVSSPARAATSFLADVPLAGQVNLLTSNLFDSPQQLLSGTSIARGIAYVKIGAPVGDHADWVVRGALNEGDLSSWIIAGAYTTRGSARRTRDIGLSYSAQRYEGGNPLALRAVTEGSRNAGSIYAYETLSLRPSVSVAYGARYERFDYLDQRNLLSPRAEVTVRPFAHTRLSVALSSRADAPGAQEFQPPSDEGIWLPPQRTFSGTERGQPLRAQRATQLSAVAERDWGAATLAFRAFTQHVDDQMVTLFGADAPDVPGTRIGHYLVSTAGDVDARGGSLAIRTDLGPRLRASVAYTTAIAQLTGTPDIGYILLLPPSAVRSRPERLQDITATMEAAVPETATRVLVFYRVGSGYARPGDSLEGRVDSRFDVQVRQALPFLNFTNAKWEMLIAMRNSFREVTSDQTVYDELLTIQPPKRVIGGVTLHF